MRARLTNVATRLRTSFWFLPTTMAAGGVLLAVAALWLDQRGVGARGFLRRVVEGGPEGASALLSTLAGSMVTVTGVVFSITIVTLSLASNQFGPRLLRSFMRDRATQVVLGTFIATFVYCLVALVNIGGPDGSTARFTVAVAVLLTLVSIAVLIFFIHHVAMAIQADTVVAHVHRDLRHRIEVLYGGPGDGGGGGSGAGNAGEDRAPTLPSWEPATLAAPRSGYLQSVGESDLAEAADRLDVVVRVLLRPGDFVAAGAPLLEVWSGRPLDDRARRRLLRHLIVGDGRTEEQDVAFAVDQLVEVAARALSPGINDPFTAVTCLDRLGSALRRLAVLPEPSPHRFHGGRLRVVVRRHSFEEVADAAFHPLRRHGRGFVSVLGRMLDALGLVAAAAEDLDRRRVLAHHAALVMEDARAGDHNPADVRLLEERHRRLAPLLAER